jgi:hypothetical protein
MRSRAGIYLAVLVTGLAYGPLAQAQASDVAEGLGQVLASEQGCALQYDRNAIERFIGENVDAHDMAFTEQLGLETRVVGREVARMSPSSLAAHCSQIRRVAKANGFIK